MNDGQADLMAELRRLGEKVSTLSLSGRGDHYGMIKDCIALQAEVKQMKEELENQKIKYKKVNQLKKELEETQLEVEHLKDKLGEQKIKYDEELANQLVTQFEMQKELEKQKNAHEKVSKELAELKIDHEDLERNMLNDFQHIGMEIAEIHKNASDSQKNSDSSSNGIPCELLKEFHAIRSELKQSKEQQNEKYEKMFKELAEQQKMQLEVNQKTEETSKLQKLSNSLEIGAMRSEMKKLKEDQVKQKKSLENQIGEYDRVCKDLKKQTDEVEKMKVDQEKQKVEYKKVCDELAALKTKQSQDVTVIREEAVEMMKMQEIRNLKILGKWKMVSSTGRKEYDKQMLTYNPDDRDRAKITYKNREFIYDGTLRSYVDNGREDPAFSEDYEINTGTVVDRIEGSHSNSLDQLINIDVQKEQLVVLGCLYKDSKEVATCRCYYDRVD